MNPILVASSFLFAVPIALSAIFQQHTVTLATLACFLTSLANHYYECPPIRTIDIIVVNTAGLCFTIDALLCIRSRGYAAVMVIAAGTIAYYAYTKFARKPDSWHAVVHLLSNAGICAYILAGAVEEKLCA